MMYTKKWHSVVGQLYFRDKQRNKYLIEKDQICGYQGQGLWRGE